MITPLKDRFGSQIRTHYPLEVATEMAIIDQEAALIEADGLTVWVPEFMTEVVATFSHLARQSSNISQRSGVSVRLSVSNQESLVANATRRALRSGETEVVPRVCDLVALAASTAGKIEIESIDDGRDGQIVEHLINSAVLLVSRDRLDPSSLLGVVEAFAEREPVEIGEDVAATDYVRLCTEIPALGQAARTLVGSEPSAARLASAVEFVLEGLHLAKRLNKEAIGGRAQYRSRG